MTSVKLSRLTALFLAVMLMFTLTAISIGATDVTASSPEETTAAPADTTAAPAETTAAPAETTSSSSGSTTDKKEEKKGINWDLIVTLAVIAIAVIVFVIFYFAKASFREKVQKFCRDYKSELKKIVWSPARDVKRNTIAVIVIALAFALAIGLLDLVFSKGIGSITDLIRGN
ncbi:MAG: preprotein translocase subunit SecE [Clostridia bacterium]|nr:preprotein translocase subunit SecE [Clostridia bacterium]